MTLEILPDALASALILAGTYTLVGLGWVLIFRATRVLNFATGQFLFLGGLVFWSLQEWLNFGFILALAGALILTAGIGCLSYVGLLRPMAGQPVYSQIILTMGLSIIMASVMSMIWGTQSRVLSKPVEDRTVALPGDATVTIYGLTSLVVAASFLVGMLLLLARSRIGTQMRAAADRSLLASQTGININWTFMVSWGIAIAGLTLAGVSYGYANVLSPGMVALGLRGLAPALIGGLDSVGGVAVGAVLVAVIETLAVIQFGGDAQNAAAFGTLLIVLGFRPYGLFGTPEVRRV